LATKKPYVNCGIRLFFKYGFVKWFGVLVIFDPKLLDGF